MGAVGFGYGPVAISPGVGLISIGIAAGPMAANMWRTKGCESGRATR